MTTLPLALREALREHCTSSTLTVESSHDSENGQTTRYLLRTTDDRLVECVIMRHLSGRTTLCVSCQVGCPMGCLFCATGRLGLTRNLSYAEILDQVMIARARLASEGRALRNVVFMGMGEPLLNYNNVNVALRVLIDQKKLNLSARRITVSTCGIVPGIARMADDWPQVSLAISLHAPTQEAREKIMPVARAYPLSDLMQALDDYTRQTRNRVFYEYIMLAGYTDRPEYATALASLLRGRLAHVNLIPYNAGEGGSAIMEPSSRIVVERFQRMLEDTGTPSTVRHTMGDDIDAACGQLALQAEKDKE